MYVQHSPLSSKEEKCWKGKEKKSEVLEKVNKLVQVSARWQPTNSMGARVAWTCHP